MEAPVHSMNALFAQLGLGDSDSEVNKFIVEQPAIPGDTPLHKGTMWNASQASFLREAVADDADWAEVVDQLDAMLRDA